MSISGALNNALSGLTANSRMAEVVSSNLANALTDGYGRRVVDLAARSVGGRGAGVTVVGVQRLVDRGVLADRRLADAGLANFGRSAAALGKMQLTVGQPGEPGALSSRIAAFETALVTASSDPMSEVRLQGAVEKLRDVTSALQQSNTEIRNQRQDADAAIALDVDALNTGLGRLERLNADITLAVNTGQDSSALQDQRQQIVDGLAKIVPLRELERPNGQIALMTASGQMLIDGPAVKIGFEPHGVITADMTLASGALSGLTVNGLPMFAGDGVGRLGGGSLGASFSLRDQTLTAAQTNLDLVARDLVDRLQGSGVDPTQTASSAGLLTDAGGAFDPINITGLAGRIAVNAAVDSSQGGAAFRLRDGVYATTPQQAGSSAQIESWLSALADDRPTSGGAVAKSAAGHAVDFVSGIAGELAAIEDNQSYASARWSSLRESELSQGVDTDQELQMLMRIEQAYAANARVVQTVDTLIRTLMEL